MYLNSYHSRRHLFLLNMRWIFLYVSIHFFTRFAVMLKFLHILLLGSFIEFVGAPNDFLKKCICLSSKSIRILLGMTLVMHERSFRNSEHFFYFLKYATNSFENWKWIATISEELIFDNLKNGSVTQQTLTCVIVMCTCSVVCWLCGIFAQAKSWWIILIECLYFCTHGVGDVVFYTRHGLRVMWHITKLFTI